MKKYGHWIVFLLALGIFGAIQACPGFGDPDAYYHLEMAKLTAAAGPVRVFAWLPFTTLADHYADQHFLYHLALIPFLNLFGDFFGLKIATVLFAALAMAAFAWMLGAYGLRRPWLWTLPLLVSTGFLFRLLLTKATGLALVALFLFLGFLKKKNRAALFLISFAYVWLHAGWPILGVVVFIYALAHRDWKTPLVVAAGLLAGLVVNPFFPSNFAFNWEQIVQIAVLGHRDPGVLVGNEWGPVDIGWLLAENAVIFLAAGAAFAQLISLIYRQEKAPEVSEARQREIAFAAALSCLFLCLTLRQARQKEYFLPFVLFFAALLGDALQLDARETFDRVRAKLGRWSKALLALVTACVTLLCLHGVWYAHKLYAGRLPFSRFAAAGAWMQTHVPAGETVFHSAWDDFPYLFYRDPDARYVAGMDPLFLYRKDPARYWLWRDIGDGRRRNPSALIKNNFDAQYIFVRRERDALRPIIEKDPSVERVYQDSEAEVWRIR